MASRQMRRWLAAAIIAAHVRAAIAHLFLLGVGLQRRYQFNDWLYRHVAVASLMPALAYYAVSGRLMNIMPDNYCCFTATPLFAAVMKRKHH